MQNYKWLNYTRKFINTKVKVLIIFKKWYSVINIASFFNDRFFLEGKDVPHLKCICCYCLLQVCESMLLLWEWRCVWVTLGDCPSVTWRQGHVRGTTPLVVPAHVGATPQCMHHTHISTFPLSSLCTFAEIDQKCCTCTVHGQNKTAKANSIACLFRQVL
jgi:hypothetical protein